MKFKTIFLVSKMLFFRLKNKISKNISDMTLIFPPDYWLMAFLAIFTEHSFFGDANHNAKEILEI